MDRDYPKAFQTPYLEQLMEEATGALNVLVQASEEYPEQIWRCDERTRQLFQDAIWRAAKPARRG